MALVRAIFFKTGTVHKRIRSLHSDAEHIKSTAHQLPNYRMALDFLTEIARSESKMLSLQSFLRKDVSLGYVGRNYNLQDLKALQAFRTDTGICPATLAPINCQDDYFGDLKPISGVRLCWELEEP